MVPDMIVCSQSRERNESNLIWSRVLKGREFIRSPRICIENTSSRCSSQSSEHLKEISQGEERRERRAEDMEVKAQLSCRLVKEGPTLTTIHPSRVLE